MDTIAIYTRKGGVGKTTLSINIAATLCKIMGKRVLVVDLDGQSNCTTFFTLNMQEEFTDSVVDIYTDDDYLSKNFCHKVDLLERGKLSKANISIIGCTKDIDIVSFPDENVTRLRTYLKSRAKDYDYCIIDCATQVTGPVLGGLLASDYIILPCFTNRDSLNGCEMAFDEVQSLQSSKYEFTASILGLVINKYNRNVNNSKFWYNTINEQLSNLTFNASISNANIIEESSSFGRPVCYSSPSNKVTTEFEILCREIIKRIASSKRRR